MENENHSRKNWHDKNYKKLLLIPAILLIFSIIYLGIFYSNNGELFHKDVSLTGGTTITIYGDFDKEKVKSDLEANLDGLRVREISDLTTGNNIALTLETTEERGITKEKIEAYLGYDLIPGQNADVVSTGSTLSESFSRQLLIAVAVAFIFMAIVVFILFKTFVPSTAVILSALADILMTLVAIDIFGIRMSSAGIVALLMLIGYSVDTDILLTTRMLKRHEGRLNKRLYDSFKTGITMTLTSLFAVSFALIIVKSFSEVLTQVFTILAIGLFFDLLNTWIMNASIIKWYALKKK